VREIAGSFFVFGASLTAFDPACDPTGRALESAMATALTVLECAPGPESSRFEDE
jgi:hypothetical protein